MIQRFRFDGNSNFAGREPPHPAGQQFYVVHQKDTEKQGPERMNENKSYIRYKRKNASVFAWPCKLYVPVTLKTKNRFAEVARMKQLSQAELGAVVVMHYLEHQQLMAQAIDAYQQVKKATESDSLHRET